MYFLVKATPCYPLGLHQFSFSPTVGGFPFLHAILPLLFQAFLMMAILACLMWYLVIFLVCISIIISVVKELFVGWLVTWMSLLGNCPLDPQPIFLFHLFIIGLYELFLFLRNKTLGTQSIFKYFLPFTRLSFSLVMVSFTV